MKKIATCPTCNRDIESVDDIREVDRVIYHEECAPEPTPEKGGKVKKPTKEQLLMSLFEQVGLLTAEIAELKKRPTIPVRKPKSQKGCPRPDVYYVIDGYPTEKRPPQCLRVFRAVAQATPENHKMTELDVWNALMAEPFPSTKANPRLGAWNHVQTPFYIFKYYRADMIDAEYVKGPFDLVQ